MSASSDLPAGLPEPLRALAQRLGAEAHGTAAAVTLEQRGWMREDARSPERRFTARQRIELTRPAFIWRARCGPLGAITIEDALIDDEGYLAVRALGLLPLATLQHDAMLTKGELIRYLAELPWAPDALLRNRHLQWQMLDDRRFRVAAHLAQCEAHVTMRLDADGRVEQIDASDRPRREGDRFVPREWRGRFWDYDLVGGRLIPRNAQVAWILDGAECVVWRGEIVAWALASR
ncbi:MAG TPA: DUF6544 family protein [Steroidobacteraceae bacterium]|nr:DUF6544 family protein [Steroidobacteraceae bacterium]